MHILEERTGREQLIEELNEVRSQLVAEKRRLRELHKELTGLKYKSELETEHHYGQLFRAMKGGFGLARILSDKTGKPFDFKIILINEEAGRIIGIEPQTAKGKRLLQLCGNGDRDWIETLINAALNGGSAQIEKYYPTVGKWFSVNAFSPETGKIACLFFDITERKATQWALKISEERFKMAAKAAGIGAYSYNIKTRKGYWSPEFMEIYGFAPNDRLPLKNGIPAAIHPEDRQRILAEIHTRMSHFSRPEFSGEHRVVLPDGKTRWVMLRGRIEFDQNGRALRSHGIAVDITDRKEAEKNLRQLAEFPEENPNPIFRCAAGGEILYANIAAKQWLTTLGWQAEKQLPLSVRTAVEKAAGQKKAVESEITNQNGRTFSLFSVQSSGEEHINLYGIDITERKQMENERLDIERRKHQIAKAESLSNMAGAVAHHFNNMLAAVMGNLEMAREDLPVKGDIAAKLAAAEQAARGAARMSQLMLRFLGQSKGELETVDFSKACHDRLLQLQVEIPDGVKLAFELPEPGPVVKADLSQIDQTVVNLVTNAWESMEGTGGEIKVVVENVDADAVPKENRFPMDWEPSKDRYACLAVTDSGCGMAPKDINRIFDPFFTDKFTGRGLGLAVTLGGIKSAGGCITVASEPGRGSTLRVYLPILSNALPETAKKIEDGKRVPVRGNTVLLVEDQKMVRQVAKAMLERLGFTVRAAGDGAEAVEIFRADRNRIRLVLSDLSMPRMDGWETLAELRRLKPDIPVILVSGYDQTQAMADDHAEKPQVFLSKPYHMGTLRAAVEKALGEVLL